LLYLGTLSEQDGQEGKTQSVLSRISGLFVFAQSELVCKAYGWAQANKLLHEWEVVLITEYSIVEGVGGGVLIGLAAALMLLLNGKISGVSGIVGGLFKPAERKQYWRTAFLVGLIGAGFVLPVLRGQALEVTISSPLWMTSLAGLLVGFGTRLGNGCTSGHGVCGLARLSGRSFAASLTFIASAMLTVYLVRHMPGA
jgi:hypothetical protein